MLLNRAIIFLFLAFFVCIVINANAQHVVDERHYPDSLQRLYQSATSDTGKAYTLFLLSDYWSDKDSAKAIQYALQAAALSKGNAYYTGLAHFYTAGVYFEYDTLQSQKEYMLAEKWLEHIYTPQAYLYRSRLWHNYGVIEQKKGNEKGFAEIIINKAIPFATKAGDSLKVAIYYQDVGTGFMNYLEYNKALEYYQKAIQILKRAGKVYVELGDCYTNTAKTHLFMENYVAAKPNLDSAFRILSANHQSSYLPEYYLTEGMYYTKIKNWDAAAHSFNKGLELANNLNRTYDALSIMFQQYGNYKGQKKYDRAKEVLLKVYAKVKIMPYNNNKQMVLYELSQTSAHLGNMTEAYHWLSEYTQLADSISFNKSRADIAALEAKYEATQKEKEILLLQEHSRKQQLALQQQRFTNYLLWGAVALSVLLLLFLYMQYRNKKRSAKLEAEAHQQKLFELEKEKKLQVYNAMLQGQEEERNRLARDLHDGLGGMLAGVKLKLSTLAGKGALKQPDMELYKVITQLDGSVNELRRIARNMMPETLLQLGLEPALSDLCNSLQTRDTHIEFQAPGLANTISQPVQITIFRIIQELLANAVRHADAHNILVQCSQNEDIVFITVEDDGKGFNPKKAQTKNGIGLANIRNRVELLHGKFEIHSVPCEGTTINIEVKINEQPYSNHNH